MLAGFRGLGFREPRSNHVSGALNLLDSRLSPMHIGSKLSKPLAAKLESLNPKSLYHSKPLEALNPSVGAVIIRIGFWGFLTIIIDLIYPKPSSNY